MCVYRNFTCDLTTYSFLDAIMYMPDEVFHDWKSIRIKEEKKKTRRGYLQGSENGRVVTIDELT
jgi:hypothetical protein